MMMPWPSPNSVPSCRTAAQYVPVSVSSTPSSFPLAVKDDSIFGPPLGFGSTRCEVTLPDVSAILSPCIPPHFQNVSGSNERGPSPALEITSPPPSCGGHLLC